MIPDRDIPYFSTIAASAATLLGLSFFALIFFLTDLFRRFAGLALPIHRQELKSRVEIANRDQERSPEHVTDFALFDGDPLVVFSAFSVAVTWNAYFVSLVVSLTAVSHQLDEAWTFAVELVAFPAFLTFSLIVRNAQRRRLATYRTRDEHFWSVFEWGFVALCGMAEAVAVIGAATMGCGGAPGGICRLAFWTRFGIDTVDLLSLVLKIVCLGGLCLGLYATNKDLFVYFKAKASDDMHERWLQRFVQGYLELKRRVIAVAEAEDPAAARPVLALWNGGCPPPEYIRDGFSPRPSAGDERCTDGVQDGRWTYLLDGKDSVASWMFDVPGVAKWAAKIETLLDERARLANQGMQTDAQEDARG